MGRQVHISVLPEDVEGLFAHLKKNRPAELSGRTTHRQSTNLFRRASHDNRNAPSSKGCQNWFNRKLKDIGPNEPTA
jgi:hypothetical protein